LVSDADPRTRSPDSPPHVMPVHTFVADAEMRAAGSYASTGGWISEDIDYTCV